MQFKFKAFNDHSMKRKTHPFSIKKIKSIKAITTFTLVIKEALQDLNNIHLLGNTMFLSNKFITFLERKLLILFLYMVESM